MNPEQTLDALLSLPDNHLAHVPLCGTWAVLTWLGTGSAAGGLVRGAASFKLPTAPTSERLEEENAP